MRRALEVLVSGLGLALALSLLAACATAPSAPAGNAVAGRLSVVVDAWGTQPPRQAGAGFELSGDAGRGALSLATPVGTLMARATWAPGKVELESPEGRREYASLEDLAEAVLGERLPLQAIADWLRGRPWPGAGHSPTGSGFEQLGWSVQTDRYAQGLLVARRAALPVVTLRARLEGSP